MEVFLNETVLETLVLNAFVGLVWAVITRVIVEIVRDTFHILGHYVPYLEKHHKWHHRVFRKDMSKVSLSLYQQSQWHHDVPESAVMLIAAVAICLMSFVSTNSIGAVAGSLTGVVFTVHSLMMTILRGLGKTWAIELDTNHKAPSAIFPPSKWVPNWSFHQRHHFDNPKAYFSGNFTFVDRLLGTGLSLRGKTVAITGASGALGRNLIVQLKMAGAKVIGLTSSLREPMTVEVNGHIQSIKTVKWDLNQLAELDDVLASTDILIINHGVNLRERSESAVVETLDVNALSSYRLLERFIRTVNSPCDAARKEAWVVTSEAEVAPAHSPIYEMSKRLLGELVTLKRLDSPCLIRKVVLGGFLSPMSPTGSLSPAWVAKEVVKAAKRDGRNIIVSPYRPWLYVVYPIHEALTSFYFKRWSKPAALTQRKVTTSPAQ